MKNVLTFAGDDFLSLENIDSGPDSIVVRYYIEDPVSPSLMVEGTAVTLTEDSHWSGMYEATMPLSGVSRTSPLLHFYLSNGGVNYQQYTLSFYDFNESGAFNVNQWQKRLQVFQTGNPLVFHGYIIALVESETTTVGAGLTTNEYGEMMVNAGAGLTTTDDGKVKVNTGAGLTTTNDGKVATVEATRSVDSIDVTESNDRVSAVTINYDDETVHTYNCSYDNDGNLISFGGVPISWTTT